MMLVCEVGIFSLYLLFVYDVSMLSWYFLFVFCLCICCLFMMLVCEVGIFSLYLLFVYVCLFWQKKRYEKAIRILALR